MTNLQKEKRKRGGAKHYRGRLTHTHNSSLLNPVWVSAAARYDKAGTCPAMIDFPATCLWRKRHFFLLAIHFIKYLPKSQAVLSSVSYFQSSCLFFLRQKFHFQVHLKMSKDDGLFFIPNIFISIFAIHSGMCYEGWQRFGSIKWDFDLYLLLFFG